MLQVKNNNNVGSSGFYFVHRDNCVNICVMSGWQFPLKLHIVKNKKNIFGFRIQDTAKLVFRYILMGFWADFCLYKNSHPCDFYFLEQATNSVTEKHHNLYCEKNTKMKGNIFM